MLKIKIAVLTSALLLAFGAQASVPLTVDTGTPDGSGFALAVDSNDFLAGQVTFSSAVQVNSINAYLDDLGNGGGTFTLALYSDNGVKHIPGTLLNSTSAAFGATGWNGATSLNWTVGAGTYWIAIEGQDPFSGGFVGVAPTGATFPLTHTAFNDGSGYKAADGLSFGLQVGTVAVVPEPENYALMLAGLGLVGVIARKKTQSK